MDEQKRQQIIGRIKKIRQLNEKRGATQEEAENAQTMINDLMLKYKLEDGDIGEDKEEEHDPFAKMGQRRCSMGIGKSAPYEWTLNLATSITYTLQCRVVVTIPTRTIYFIGESFSVDQCVESYEFLVEIGRKLSIESLIQRRKLNLGKGGNSYKQAFLLGFGSMVSSKIVNAYRESLKKAEQENANTRAIISTELENVEKYQNSIHSNLKTINEKKMIEQKKKAYDNNPGFYEGIAAGHKTNTDPKAGQLK